MNIGTSSCAASSLNTAAFRTVLVRDSRLVGRVLTRQVGLKPDLRMVQLPLGVIGKRRLVR